MRQAIYILLFFLTLSLSACNTNRNDTMTTNERIMSLASQDDATRLQTAERYITVGKMMDEVRGKHKLSRLKGHPDYFIRFRYPNQEVKLSANQQKQLDEMIQFLSPSKKYRVRVESGVPEGKPAISSYLSAERLIIVQHTLQPHFAQIEGFTRKSIATNELVIQFTAEPMDNKKR